MLSFFCFIFIEAYFLLTSLMYFSKAIVIEGVSGVGAVILHFNPASVAALTVEFPKTAILVLFCLKSGKFLNNESIPEGLKKTKIS